MASIHERQPSALSNPGLVLYMAGAALLVAATVWRGWFIDEAVHCGLRGREFQEHDGTLGKAGHFTFFATLGAVVLSILPALLPARNAARNLLQGVSGLAAIAGVIGAAYFVSELPPTARLGWSFPLYLQGMTLAVVGLALRVRDVTSSS